MRLRATGSGVPRWNRPPEQESRPFSGDAGGARPRSHRSSRRAGSPRMIPQRRRLTYALLLSLLLHALLLKLNFGGQGQWLQALGFDWIEFPDLRVLLEPAQVAPAEPAVSVAAAPASAPSRQAPTEQLPASGPTPT